MFLGDMAGEVKHLRRIAHMDDDLVKHIKYLVTTKTKLLVIYDI